MISPSFDPLVFVDEPPPFFYCWITVSEKLRANVAEGVNISKLVEDQLRVELEQKAHRPLNQDEVRYTWVRPDDEWPEKKDMLGHDRRGELLAQLRANHVELLVGTAR